MFNEKSQKDFIFNESISSAAVNPNLVGPTLPPIPPFTMPMGPTGPTGPTGPAGIVSFNFIQETLAMFAPVILSLPPITVGANQIVKLEGVATTVIDAQSTATVYTALSELILRRGNTVLTFQDEFISNTVKPINVGAGVSHNVALAWVDAPSPGTYIYSLRIEAIGANVVGPNVRQRSFSATVIDI
ncbi:exosporium leader peptide-containing protein [Bacillus pretiosus]|uniref:Exosporium leader peptide-containing protein n=1 Tax=Bacillus pretiosus TaxID=2983392 RepID=A0ABT3ER17_9BACI|nr:exosporium leader peptide-containing protein [Bacillus pretiosus]MCW1239245.1 exosporium leader peptide-containing protein [Bacillus pretiosus]